MPVSVPLQTLEKASKRSGRRPVLRQAPELAGGEGAALEDPADLFRRAAAAINERYIPGALAYIETNRPELSARIDTAFDRVNREWEAAEPAAGPAFKRALREWFDLNLLAIEIYKGRENG